jgi:thiamine-phosphate diphosphorylase
VPVKGGAKWLCVRERDAAPRDALDFTRRATRMAEKFGARVFFNGRADLARASHAAGLHLPESEISVADARLTLGFHTPIGVSVHSLESARRAEGEGANYLVFGSVWETASHANGEVAGLSELENVSRSVSIPVFAIGGVTPERAPACLQCGAAGVAAISGIWSGDVAANVRAFRAALGEVDTPHHAPPAATSKSPFADIISPKRRLSSALIESQKGNLVVPNYEYKCTQDGSVFELWQEVGAAAPPCPTCGSPTKKVFHPTRTIFKGSGFYITDTRSDSAAKSEAPAKPAETSTENKPADSSSSTNASNESKTSDAKPAA